MPKGKATVSLQIRSDYLETKKKREKLQARDINAVFLICSTVANACNVCVYHFDIAFHILCV